MATLKQCPSENISVLTGGERICCAYTAGHGYIHQTEDGKHRWICDSDPHPVNWIARKAEVFADRLGRILMDASSYVFGAGERMHFWIRWLRPSNRPKLLEEKAYMDAAQKESHDYLHRQIVTVPREMRTEIDRKLTPRFGGDHEEAICAAPRIGIDALEKEG